MVLFPLQGKLTLLEYLLCVQHWLAEAALLSASGTPHGQLSLNSSERSFSVIFESSSSVGPISKF